MTRGDGVLLTKGIAIEGTSIIAREFNKKLKLLGMPEDEIDICKQYLKQLSIVEEARIAAESNGTTAMHDVTEGGLATANTYSSPHRKNLPIVGSKSPGTHWLRKSYYLLC